MPAHEARVRAGVATVDITPETSVVMSGYGGREGRSTGVNDPLYATALVLEDGAVRVGIVAVDLLNVSRELTTRLRRSLAADGVALDELVVAASHTHAGPYVPARALDVSPALRTDEDVSEPAAAIKEGIRQAVVEAAADPSPARLTRGRTEVADVAENRRARGGVGGNVRIPDGEIDPEVGAVRLGTDDGEEAILYNFACHPVCTTGAETLLSADWPGYARMHIQEEFPDAHVLFLNGASGDINPGTTDGGRGDGDPYAFMDEVGGRVGAGVVDALDDPTHGSDGHAQASIRTDVSQATFPLKRTPEPAALREHVSDLERELAALREAGDERGAREVRFRLQGARETLAVAEWDATSLPSRLTYVELGELGLLGLPGEVHVEHGFRFKARAGVDQLFPVTYADDYVGYIPTLDDLPSVGYEVRTMKLAPDAIVEFREAAGELLARPGDL